MFIGTSTAKIGRWGRVKIPSDFLKTFKAKFADEVYVTSMDDKGVQVYPLMNWFEFVDNLHKGERDDPLLRRFLMKASYNCQRIKVDRYGRIKIPRFLGKKINLEGEMEFGDREDHLIMSPKGKRGE